MKILALALTAVLITLLTSQADARKRVRIHKPSLPVVSQPIQYPLTVVVPAVIAFDIVRRTSCDPQVAVATGPGDPGFDPNGPQTGNFLIPAIWSRCAGRPAPR